MSGGVNGESAPAKRKRTDDGKGPRKAPKSGSESRTLVDEITQLEADVTEHGPTLKSVKRLLAISVKVHDGSDEACLAACVALCRIFYRLIAGDGLAKRKGMAPEERKHVDGFRDLLSAYVDRLCRLLCSPRRETQSTAFTLIMRLVKAETSQSEAKSLQAWREGTFSRLIITLIGSSKSKQARDDFVESYVEEHDDVRYFTFVAIQAILSGGNDHDEGFCSQIGGALDLLLQIEGIPESKDQLEDWYGSPPSASASLLSLKDHKKQAQSAWLLVFKKGLDKSQRKQILAVFTERITPWFTKPETLMDFLTDSYDQSGSMPLLALEGIYYLIKERNLDYPHFYHKLYSLLDHDILHSKHRAKFFRLLDVFLSSTHLPAALVASFIKRLSRLSLHAPPGGIVMVVPWVYNMLKAHPQCTFMIHRGINPEHSKSKQDPPGMDDPFLESESDPSQTCAIDSSLWELQSLQHHYHPNVATLAKIIGEQFTKQEYNLEDFLDHTYDELIEAELGKEMKRAPVVEFEIPKRILTTDGGGLSEAGVLLGQAISA